MAVGAVISIALHLGWVCGKNQKEQLKFLEGELHNTRKELSEVKGQLDANKNVLERKGEAQVSALSEQTLKLKAEADLLQKELTLKTEELAKTTGYLSKLEAIHEGIASADLSGDGKKVEGYLWLQEDGIFFGQSWNQYYFVVNKEHKELIWFSSSDDYRRGGKQRGQVELAGCDLTPNISGNSNAFRLTFPDSTAGAVANIRNSEDGTTSSVDSVSGPSRKDTLTMRTRKAGDKEQWVRVFESFR